MSQSEQRRFKRNLLRTITRRSEVARGGCSISLELLSKEVERLLSSHGVHMATRYEIWLGDHRKEEADHRWETETRAGPVTRSYHSFESAPVDWYYKPRSTSGFRKICMFSHDERVWQRLVKDLITAQHRPRAHIGDWHGRGRNFTVQQLLAAITSPEQAVVVADVRQAFESVNIDAVYDLRLAPDELIRRVIDARSHSFRRLARGERDLPPEARLMSMAYHGNDGMVPTGLMEGSPASNAIFSVFLDDLPDHLSEDILVFVYCDNVILLSPSPSQAQQAQEALVSYFSGHRAGPFDLRSEVRPLRYAFDFLGYDIRMADENNLHVSLSPRNWLRFAEKMEDSTTDLRQMVNWLTTSFPQCADYTIRSHMELIAEDAIQGGGFNRPSVA